MLGIVNLIVDGFIFFFKVGNRSPVSDSFWRKYIAKGSFSAFCGESSSRRENNLTIPVEVFTAPLAHRFCALAIAQQRGNQTGEQIR
jgi:hypothetical protein